MTQRQSQVILLNTKKFAQICRTTPRTLRFYDKQGIFKPAKISKSNGYRFYNPLQAKDFLKLKLLHQYQVPLKGLKELARKKQLDSYLDDEIKKIAAELKQKQQELAFLKDIQALLFDDQTLAKQVKKQDIGPLTLLCIKRKSGSYIEIASYLTDLKQTAKDLGIAHENSEYIFYLEDSFAPTNTPLEIALVCKNNQNIDLLEPYYIRQLPKSTAMIYNYFGPYDYLPLVYERFYQFRDENKGSHSRVFEHYIKDNNQAKSVYDYHTQLGFLVA